MLAELGFELTTPGSTELPGLGPMVDICKYIDNMLRIFSRRVLKALWRKKQNAIVISNYH